MSSDIIGNHPGYHTVYVKSFKGEMFHGFCGFIATMKVLP